MIINPQMGGYVEQKARRARAHRSGGISWPGMPGGGGVEPQSGGGDFPTSETGGDSGPAEVTVEKLG